MDRVFKIFIFPSYPFSLSDKCGTFRALHSARNYFRRRIFRFFHLSLFLRLSPPRWQQEQRKSILWQYCFESKKSYFSPIFRKTYDLTLTFVFSLSFVASLYGLTSIYIIRAVNATANITPITFPLPVKRFPS